MIYLIRYFETHCYSAQMVSMDLVILVIKSSIKSVVLDNEDLAVLEHGVVWTDAHGMPYQAAPLQRA